MSTTSTKNCLPREVLKQYLGGAYGDQLATEIEMHLESCPECEKTIVALDSEPDTLLESLRNARSEATDSSPSNEWSVSSGSNATEFPSVIEKAVDAARRIPVARIQMPAIPLAISQIGAYDLIRPLGRGGMGMVVLARHRSLQKEVAIKLLTPLPGDRTDLVTRFRKEMRTSGRLNHPAIVYATDAGQEQGTHFLVMEYIDGLDLSRVARLAGILKVADACELVRQAAIGLSHAHSAGVVHRDIKPSNLMLDRAGRLKILDFGLAQLRHWGEAAGELTTIGQLMGTLDYMAPEQAERSEAVDYRADLYSLGATLFRLLAGRAPLAAAPNMSLIDKVRILGTETAPLLTSFRNDCPPALVALVKQLLSRDRSQRPASAAHVAQLLEPFCQDHQLVDLLSRAQATALQDVSEEATEFAPQQLPSLQYATQPEAISPPRRRWPWVLCALVPLIAWAGIFIMLETQKGQLVIQSDVADVHIQVAKDGKLVNQLIVQPGAQSTRLRADKYEIRIDSPSDQVVLDKQQFTIKNGETVVATIKRTEKTSVPLVEPNVANFKEQVPTQAPNHQPTINPELDSPSNLTSNDVEPSLEEWLLNLERYRNMPFLGRGEVEMELQGRALSRIAELTTGDRVAEVSQRLLAVAKNVDVSLWSDMDKILTPAKGIGNRATLDVLLLDCLRQIHSEAAFQQLLESNLLALEDNWTARWFAVLLKLVHKDRYHFSPSDEYKSTMLASHGRDRYGPKTSELAFAFLLRNLLTNKNFAEQHSQSLIEMANSNPYLGRTASLSIDCRLEGKFNPFNSRTLAEGELEVEQAVATFAMEVMMSSRSTPEELALAAGRLATTTEIVLEWRAELVASLRNRILEVAMNPTRLPALLENRNNSFDYARRFGLEYFPSTNVFIESKNRGREGLNTSRSIRSEAISYIALTKRLSATTELSDELTQLMKSTSDAYIKVAIKQRVEPPKPLALETRVRYGFRADDSPITWWPFDDAVLKSMGASYADLPQGVWIQWAIFRELSSAIPNEQSPMIRLSKMAWSEVDLKVADSNQDGKISQTERSALPELMQGREYQDLNGDGFIDQDEIMAARY